LAVALVICIPATLALLMLPTSTDGVDRGQGRGRGGGRGRDQRWPRRIALLIVWGLFIWIMLARFGPAVHTVADVVWGWKIRPELQQ
ncbi:MAG: hypothetical protein ACOC0P_07475, partial [Planctomycetota bacterium]